MAKKKYEVVSPVKFGGIKYPVGSVIELDSADEADLRAAEVLGDEVVASAANAPTDPAERAAVIKEAIGSLDKDNAALWTGTGMPKVPAIAAVTGWDVTQAERDAVWAEINKV
jgi:hypothetical protein